MAGGYASKRPFNWNGTCVEVASLDVERSKVDPVFKTARPQKRRIVRYLYDAQINLGGKRQDRKSRTEHGDRTNTRGWIVIRTADIAPNADLPKPQKGWQITRIYVGTDMEQEVDYLIEEVRHESPYKGRPLLIYCEFDRNREKAPSLNG